MKKISISILIILFLQIIVFSQSNFDDCTIGVASGSATQDGRPLAWKTRDFDSYYNMRLKYHTYCDYKFIIITPTTNYSTTGLNEHGLVIFKSNTYDLTAASTGPNDTQIQEYTLGYCRTVDEFQDYLDSTNITGRSTTGNFALIDSTGAAAIFEVAGYEYWRFDAEDEPDGYIIRTNFTVNGGGATGLDRYNRSSFLLSDFYAGDSLNHKSLIKYHMRDFSDYTSQPYPVPFLDQISSIPYGYFPAQYSICRNISTSSAVIQGVLPGENAVLSTLWAMLGQPAAAIAAPYWPVGNTPTVSNGNTTAPLCDIALDIKDLLFDNTTYTTSINSHLLRDTTGGGLWTCTFPIEDLILDNVETQLNAWRNLDSIPVDEMLEAENDLAEIAYESLVSCYENMTVGVEVLAVNNEFSIYPNPASSQITIELPTTPQKNTSLTIYNLNGQQLLTQPITEPQTVVDVSGLPKGVYFVKVADDEKVMMGKVIKQ